MPGGEDEGAGEGGEAIHLHQGLLTPDVPLCGRGAARWSPWLPGREGQPARCHPVPWGLELRVPQGVWPFPDKVGFAGVNFGTWSSAGQRAGARRRRWEEGVGDERVGECVRAGFVLDSGLAFAERLTGWNVLHA